jgi:hypothetical protein
MRKASMRQMAARVRFTEHVALQKWLRGHSILFRHNAVNKKLPFDTLKICVRELGGDPEKVCEDARIKMVENMRKKDKLKK